jgi:acyl-CoA thioester hydrolase
VRTNATDTGTRPAEQALAQDAEMEDAPPSIPPLLQPLRAPELRGLGIPEPWTFGQADRVRFSELDVLDHVNNARYLSWFESLRIAYLRDYGVSDYAGRERPVLVLKRVGVSFHAPLHLEDVYVVTGRTRSFRRTSWVMEYGVWSRGKLCAEGDALIVHMAQDGVTRAPLGERMRDAFVGRDGAVSE